MSFLAPLFLLGGLAVALPIIFHLIRRATRERTRFSSLMFLQQSPPRLTHRSRLEHILLLLLRCAVLCLLAIAFARPFIKKPVTNDIAPGAAGRIVILVDTSASMRRPDLWKAARDKVGDVLSKVAPADQVAVYTFDSQLNSVLSFDQWRSEPLSQRAALAMSRLESTSPGWAATHLGNALVGAAEALADTTARVQTGARQIVLISDLQEGSHLDQLQGFEWPKGITLTVETLKPRPASNAGIQLVTDTSIGEVGAPHSTRVRVYNAADSKREQFKVGWAKPDGTGFLGQPKDVYVPAGQSRIIPLESDTNSSTRVMLEGDDQPFDNSVYVTPTENSRVTVLYVGNDSPQDTKKPLFFLRNAFQQTRLQSVQVQVQAPATLQPGSDDKSPALIVVSENLDGGAAAGLHEQLLGGKTLLLSVRNQDAAPMLATLSGVQNVKLEDVKPANYALLAEINFQHPLFSAFADPRFSDFTKIHFWQYRRLDAASLPGATFLAKFDSGDPALLEMKVGKGRLVILTSGWQPEDSQLALSTKFVPLLYSLLDLTGGLPQVAMQYHVGDVLPLSSAAQGITVPGGSTVALAKDSTNFSGALIPGIYRTTPDSKLFAVNLDPAESRTAPLPADELERLGAPGPQLASTRTPTSAKKVLLQYNDLESRQKLWRWLVLATLAILLIETWLAGRTSRASVPSTTS